MTDPSIAAVVAGFLAADRETVIIRAFWTLVGAGAFVSLGAWILLGREIRRQRHDRAGTEEAEVPAAEEPAG